MGRLVSSPLWSEDIEVLMKVLNESYSISNVLNTLGYKNNGRNQEILRKRFWNEKNIKFSDITRRNRIKRNALPEKRNTRQGRLTVKQKEILIESGALEYMCYECGQQSEWNGKPLVLQFDHIDGDPCNNNLDNLRILCPNCHTQTTTWGGKNSKKQ